MTAPTTMREVLDIIDEALARNDHEAEQLWAVLTALRGPDSNNSDLKLRTTAVIRSRAFPRTAKIARESTWDVPGGATYAESYMPLPTEVPRNGQHFDWHVHCAAIALVGDGDT